MSLYSNVLHWFRRDLRLSDNTALHAACADSAAVVPVYVVSGWKGEHRWTGAPRQEFLAGCLASLEKNVAAVGGTLIFRQGDAVETLLALAREVRAEAIYANADPDPFGRAVEAELAKRAAAAGIALVLKKDAVLHAPDEVLTGGGTPYRVFTPYCRNWLTQEKPPVLGRVTKISTPPGVKSLPCPTLATWGLPPSGVTLPEPGERAARDRMKAALTKVVPHYAETRNTPHGATTSRLSPDLRMGTLSIRELYHRAALAKSAARDSGVRRSVDVWINELAWREFYMQILAHYPEVLEHEFDPQWRGLPWEADEERLSAWQEGRTGFPIVDAGMRELRATGLMHNRVRMITAMFLSKDLHLDWRLGEEFFMRSLLDGEIASNNGGWQWSAGTGADAAPYFRIQNPWSQTKSYDADGAYIRQWVPELKGLPGKAFLAPPGGGLLARGYPAPIVDHAAERERTLAMFKKHKDRRAGLA